MEFTKQLQVIFNNTTINKNRVIEVEKIADDFAIAFYEWTLSDKSIDYAMNIKTTAELLTIFKEKYYGK